MADKKISALTAATTPLAGTEVLPIVQSSTTVKVSVANLTAGRDVSALSYSGTNDSTFNGVVVGRGTGSVSTNTVVGASALTANTSGGNNTSVGSQSLLANTTGTGNTAFGRNSLQSNDLGSNNTAVGRNTLLSCSGVSSANNTAIGYLAGNSLTSGSNNGLFGYNAQPSSATASNEYTYGDSSVTAHRFYGNLTPLAAAKGINFTANTGAAGMTSQLLNWYEEGTFTPTITGGSSNPTVTYNRQFGTYTRIGRCVYFIIYIEITTIAGGSGDAYISGLPFTCKSGTQFYSPIEAWTSGVNWTGTVLKPLVVQGATSIWLLGNTDNAAYGATPVTDLANGNEFRMSGMYFV